jgi:hypothetical protein
VSLTYFLAMLWFRPPFRLSLIRFFLIRKHLIQVGLRYAQNFPQRALKDFRVWQFSLWVSHLHGLYYTRRAWRRRPAAVGLRQSPAINPSQWNSTALRTFHVRHPLP